MNPGPNRIRKLFAELKRRQVFKIAAVYGATAFVVIEAADLTFTRLGLPEWTVTLVVALALLGFPIALVLAWAFELTPEGVKRAQPAAPDELEAIARAPRRQRWRMGLAALAAIVLPLAAVWFAGGRELVRGRAGIDVTAPSSEAASDRTLGLSIAVLPFAVQGSAELAYLREGMVNLLSTKLDGAGELRSVDPRTLLRYVERQDVAPGDPVAARRIADQFGAVLYVVGDLVEAGGRIQLAAALYDRRAGRDPVSRGAVSGEVDGLFELVDELAARLLSGLSGGPAARVRRIAAVTTSSLLALKAFLEGEELFRRAQFGAAVESFQRAVAEDTLFGLAYYRLSLAAEWNLQDGLARQAAEQAVRYDQRLSDRDRRLLEAFLVRRRGANAEAERHYRSILGTHPDEMEAWLDLGEVLFHANPLRGRSFAESREALGKVLDFDPRHSTALIHLSRLAAYEGDLAELDSLVSLFMALNPEPGRTLELDALRAFASGEPAAIEATMARLEPAGDLGVALAVWAAGVYSGDLGGAERVAELLTAPHRAPEARRLGYAWLAHLKLAAGQWEAAQACLAELADLSEGAALEYRALLARIPFVPVDDGVLTRLAAELQRLDPQSVATSDNPSVVFTAHDRLHPLIRLYLLGLVHARLGDAAARRYAGELVGVELPRTAGSLAEDLARSVRARILIREGRPAEALAELDGARMETWYGQTMASPLYSQVFERFVRAELLFQLGRLEEARGWYANLVETSPFELPYLAMSHLRRAEIDERLGVLERAREHYTRFIELWQEADPPLQPQVDAARARLADLRAREEAERSP